MSNKLNYKIFLCRSDVMKSYEKIKIEKIRHTGPKTTCLIAIDRKDSTLYEIMQLNEDNRSWFVNENLCTNGKVYMMTQLDPVYFLLQYLSEHATKQAILLDDIFDPDFPSFSEVVKLVPAEQLEMIADLRRSGKIVAFKFNLEKSLVWLSVKVRSLCENLRKRFESVAFNVIENDKSEEKESQNHVRYLKMACDIICEHVSLGIAKDLRKFLEIDKLEAVFKRKNDIVGHVNDSKKIKLEDFQLTASKIEIKTTAEKKLTSKQKNLIKAASGTKSISGFFTKK